MGFSRQKYWSGLPFPPPWDPGIEPSSPAWAGGFFTTEPPGNPEEMETKPQVYEQLLRSRKHSPLEAASGSLCVCVCVCARAGAHLCVCVLEGSVGKR